MQAHNQLILWGKKVDPTEMAKKNEKFGGKDTSALVPRN